MMNQSPHHPFVIAGRGGGGGKRGRGGGGGSEAPNSLKSRQIARIIDLLSEGPIVGPWDGAKSVYFDGVPVLGDDGTPNFENWTIAGNSGWPDQPVLPGFAQQQGEVAVSLQIKKDTPLTRTILNGDVNRCRVTVSVPALQVQNTTSGDIKGTSVVFRVYLQSNGGGFALVTEHTISGKTNTRYQRALAFPLTGDPPWDIRLERVTADSTKNNLQNDLYWDSFTEIIDQKINYTLSAVIGYTIDAEQFQTIPKRVVDCGGLIISVPSNYDPITRVYTGVWNGTFKQAWTDSPAWVLYDLVTQNRYGLGDFVSINDIDKWGLYSISQWCDALVPNGRGGQEPRWTFNGVVSSQQEAFDLLAAVASVFRGGMYWAGGQMVGMADKPSDPVAQYTNANVLDGAFSYHDADIFARKTQYLVRWNDPTNLGEPRPALVEDQTGIAKFGIKRDEIIAIGCTSEGQAQRVGEWAIYTDVYEGQTVDFVPGLEAAWARPGDIIQIADVNVGGERRGGRIVSATTTAITLDAAVTLIVGQTYYLSCILPDGAVVTRKVSTGGGSHTKLTVAAFAEAPLPDTVWVLASSDLQPTLWRVLTARQTDTDRYEIVAQRHLPGKWDYIERDKPLSQPDISNIGIIPPVKGLNAKDYLVVLSPISLGVRMLISWQSLAPVFDLAYRPVNGNWIRVRVDQTAHDVEVEEGDYDIWITPLNVIGRRGVTTKIRYTVVGKVAPPADPVNFRIQLVENVAMFQWAPATEIDMIIGGSFEMRYSPQTAGATWASAGTVLTSIPGTATTVELPYRRGTYMLKARDAGGTYSANAVAVITNIVGATQSFVRICEQPTWLGTKVNCKVQLPQEWLIITDEQAGLGTYTFKNQIDMGGVFPVVLSVDMLAFPYYEGDVFIDARPGLVDDWQSWDSAIDDGEGMVTVQVRQTDGDPASGTSVWSAWTQFIAGEYVARGFQFRALMDAPPDQNVAIEQLCIIADVTAKQESGADTVWQPSKQRINFLVKFKYVPAVSIAIQNAALGDYFVISNKSNTGFDLELKNSTGAIITAARTFDWIAAGY